MRGPSLTWTLASGSALLVLGTLVGVGGAARSALRHLAQEQALARVELAATAAEAQVEAEKERLLTSVHLLAERPTLHRLLAEDRPAELRAFLESFRETGELGGCAVTEGGTVRVAAGNVEWERFVPWPAAGSVALVGWMGAEAPWAASSVAVPELDGTAVLVAGPLGEAFAAGASHRVGLPVQVLAGQEPERGLPARRRGDYLAYRPLTVTGAPEGLGRVEVRLPAETVEGPLSRLLGTLLLTALAAAAAVLGGGLLLGHRLVRPVRQLSAAARRLGRGDLHSQVPPAPGPELGSLAATLEDARKRLLEQATELRRQEAEVRAVVEGIEEGVFAVDGERRITYVSPQAARRLGLSVDEAEGRFCGDVLRPLAHRGRLPCHDDCPIVHARSRGTTRSVERLRGPEGEVQAMVVTSAPPVGGRQVQVLRSESREEAGRRVRDALLANLSHELKTPLAAQLASIELLGDGLGSLPEEQVAELVASLQRSTLRLTSLIDNLLGSVRLEAGEWPTRQDAVDLGRIAEEAAGMLSPLLAQRRQTILWERPAELPQVVGDATQLTHVCLNLLSNAHRFAPEGSTIRLVLRPEGSSVYLAVEDEGPGLPPGGEKALFEPFRRSEGGPGGVGLGLAVVRSLVDQHGGSIRVEESPVGGARFAVLLPQAVPEVAG